MVAPESARGEDGHIRRRKQWSTLIPGLVSQKVKPSSKKVQKLIEHGIPPAVRGTIWPILIGNPLLITEELYTICLERSSGEDLDRGKESSRALIPNDIARTLPELAFFRVGGPMYEQLSSVLEAFVKYRPDLGYIQGTSLIAAVLLLYTSDWLAFRCLASILHDPGLIALLRMDPGFITHYLGFFDRQLKLISPATARHLLVCGVHADMYVPRWVLSLFVQAVPLDAVCRLWDTMFGAADPLAVTFAALSILLSVNILEMDPDDIMGTLTHRIQVDPSALVARMGSISKTLGASRMRQARADLGAIVAAYT